MMRRAALATACFLAAPVALPACAATLRGGEHGAFTRLVFFADGPVTWNVDGFGRAAVVRFYGAVPDLDLADAFLRIGRERIAAVSWRDGALGLDLGCDCVPKVTQRTDDLVVIDVVPRVDDATLPPALRGPLVVPVPVIPDPPTAPDTSRIAAMGAIDAVPELRSAAETVETAPVVGTSVPERTTVEPSMPEWDESGRSIVEARMEVEAETAVPAAPVPPAAPPIVTTVPVGVPLVLDPIRVPLGERLDRALHDQIVEAGPGALTDPVTPATAKPDGAQLRTRDARAPAGPPGLRETSAPTATCEGADALRPLLLADPAEARAALPDLEDAFAEGDVTEARALHAAYLSAGLGAEAARLAPAAEVEGPWLPLLSDVLDADPGASAPEIAWGCGAEAVLLALNVLRPPEPITAEAADQVAALVGLMPMERRRDVLPRALARLESAGEDALAARLDGLPGAEPQADPLRTAETRADALTDRLDTGGAAMPAAADTQDALAMLSTLPESEARHDLAAAAAAAVAVDGNLSALGLVMDGADATLRGVAVDAIVGMWASAPSERRGVLAAALLRWRADTGRDARAALASAAEAEGLATVAARWRGLDAVEAARPDIARAESDLGPVDVAWLSRDLDAAAAQAEAADAPTRARLAALIAEPATDAPADTFQGAADRLARAGAARAALSGLLEEGDALLAAASDGAVGTDR